MYTNVKLWRRNASYANHWKAPTIRESDLIRRRFGPQFFWRWHESFSFYSKDHCQTSVDSTPAVIAIRTPSVKQVASYNDNWDSHYSSIDSIVLFILPVTLRECRNQSPSCCRFEQILTGYTRFFVPWAGIAASSMRFWSAVCNLCNPMTSFNCMFCRPLWRIFCLQVPWPLLVSRRKCREVNKKWSSPLPRSQWEICRCRRICHERLRG